MATVIKLKRGTEASRQGLTLASGEVIVTTDTNKMYVGDGSSTGGKAFTASMADTAASASYFNFSGTNVISSSAQVVSSLNNQRVTAADITASNIVVQTLQVSVISQSVDYFSGSHTFGNELTNVQQFTGSVNVTGSLTINGPANFSVVNTTTSTKFQVNGTTALFISNDRKVGISTENPIDKLEVEGNVFANAFNAVGSLSRYYSFGGIGVTGNAGSGYAKVQAYSDASGTPKILALNSDGGNVGIGTTSPQSILHISKQNAPAHLIIDSQSSGAGDSALRLIRNSIGNEELRIIAAAGGSLSGTNNTYLIDVIGNPAARNIRWRTSIDGGSTFTDTMCLTAGGSLGIGVINPSEKLEVSGSIKTLAPSGSSSQPWKFGASSNGLTTVDINGTVVKLVEESVVNGMSNTISNMMTTLTDLGGTPAEWQDLGYSSGSVTPTGKITVRINGVDYYLSVTPV